MSVQLFQARLFLFQDCPLEGDGGAAAFDLQISDLVLEQGLVVGEAPRQRLFPDAGERGE
jgi:hypothetical protein